MRIATTAVLGAAALALGAAIHRVDHARCRAVAPPNSRNVLVRFAPESVDRIIVERGAEKTVLTKRQGAWYFAEPEEDRVDATLALALLDGSTTSASSRIWAKRVRSRTRPPWVWKATGPSA